MASLPLWDVGGVRSVSLTVGTVMLTGQYVAERVAETDLDRVRNGERDRESGRDAML